MPAFVKMHGLGNDFVVLDAREGALPLDEATARRITDRKTGIGCDQLIVIEPSDRADVFMRIRNADGGEVEACGNAARCIAALVMAEKGTGSAKVDSLGGLLQAEAVAGGGVRIDMGVPRLDWQQIPLHCAMDSLHLDFAPAPGLADPVAVNVGNPHVIFFVDDAAAVDLERCGPAIEHDPLFPARVNVNIAQVLDRDRIRLRVWERGVGITRACGTGACATAVAAMRRGLTGRAVEVRLDGGALQIAWPEAGPQQGHVLMTGPATESFRGTFADDLLAGDGISPQDRAGGSRAA
ncbi:diaminopimelate epimerase [Marinibaculum pumilum]|uniref:Diaminopimelate epimerase n=1 Tax=Marinibaculum pumilum TaxID=1766165 RepID=A0ABV7L0W5_9PROT